MNESALGLKSRETRELISIFPSIHCDCDSMLRRANRESTSRVLICGVQGINTRVNTTKLKFLPDN